MLWACVPAGVSVPPPGGLDEFATVVVVERRGPPEARTVQAERIALESGQLPERHARQDLEAVLLFYRESLEELGLEAGPVEPGPETAHPLAPHRVESFSGDDLRWQTQADDPLVEWALPYLLPHPCSVKPQHRGYRPRELEGLEDPADGRLPAFTLLVPLDETRALLASGTGRFFRLEWPFGAEPSLTPVQTSTLDYHLSAFRAGDVIQLGGLGARTARASVPPLLEDPPRLMLEAERTLAERSPGLEHAIVSISGDPRGATDLFFMTESTEVFHWGEDGVRPLGPMDERQPRFRPRADLELRGRKLAWIAPGRAVAAWDHDADQESEASPVELDLEGRRSPLPVPLPPHGEAVSVPSVVFDPEFGLFVSQTYRDGVSTRGRIFQRSKDDEAWRRFAALDFAVRDMVPGPGSVFAVGGFLSAFGWAGAGQRAQRGFDFTLRRGDERCLWFRPNGRQRLAARFGPGRLLSTGTTVGNDPPWVFMLQE